MLVTVAAATGRLPRALLDEPLWELLYTYYHLEDREQRRALERRMERVDHGLLTARAFNAPVTLADELQAAHDAVAAYERGPVDRIADVTALRARGEALAAKIDRDRALTPAALVGEVRPS